MKDLVNYFVQISAPAKLYTQLLHKDSNYEKAVVNKSAVTHKTCH